jgi:NitT/TauT family transport system substrate-binding protein
MNVRKGPAIAVVAVIAVLVIAAVVLLFPSVYGSGGQSKTVRVGVIYPTTSIAFLQAGVQNGFFSKYGLDVSLVQFSSPALVLSALLKGDIQFGVGTAGDVLFFDTAGGDAKIVATYVDHIVFSIATAPNYTTPQSLVGHVAAVSSTAGSDYLAIALMLNASGVNPGSLSYLPSGTIVTSRIALVENGEAQVVATTPDYLPAVRAAGLNVLAEASQFPAKMAWADIYGLAPYLSANKGTVDSFMKGLQDTLAWFTTNEAGASAVINSYLKLNNITQAEVTWQSWSGAWASTLAPDLAGIRNTQTLLQHFNPTLAGANPKNVVDSSFFNATLAS